MSLFLVFGWMVFVFYWGLTAFNGAGDVYGNIDGFRHIFLITKEI